MSTSFHEQALLVVGFIGGFALTALVLVLANQNLFDASLGPSLGGFWAEAYFKSLIVALSGISAVSILGSLSSAIVAGDATWRGTDLDKFASICFGLSIASMLALFPILLVPFTHIGLLVIVPFEMVMLIIFIKVRFFPRK